MVPIQWRDIGPRYPELGVEANKELTNKGFDYGWSLSPLPFESKERMRERGWGGRKERHGALLGENIYYDS